MLEDTPPVLSIGRLCIDDWFGFYWDPGSYNPCLVLPSGRAIHLETEDYVPIIEDFEHAINQAEATKALPAGTNLHDKTTIKRLSNNAKMPQPDG